MKTETQDRYVVCRTTGTILNLQDCYVVTAEQLGDASTDSEIAAVTRNGHKVLDPTSYTQKDALDIVEQWRKAFKWQGVLFTRDDLTNSIINHYGYAENLDDKVTAIMASRFWNKYLEDALIREGSEYIEQAIYDHKYGDLI